MRVIIDTCVIIDVLQKREPFFADSHAAVLLCARGMVEGWFAAKAITDVYYLMHRHYHENEPCLDVVRKLYKLFKIADTTAEACLLASFSVMGDYEDAVLNETAHTIGVDYIVTRNISDFKRSSVPAITPKELMERVRVPSDKVAEQSTP